MLMHCWSLYHSANILTVATAYKPQGQLHQHVCLAALGLANNIIIGYHLMGGPSNFMSKTVNINI